MSVLELKGEIFTQIALVEDEERLKRLLFLLMEELKVGEPEEDWWENLSPIQQKRLLHLQEEARAGKNLISDEEAWKRLKRWAPQ